MAGDTMRMKVKPVRAQEHERRAGLPFDNRMHAGASLARALASYAGDADAIVLALPRGGVPVGFALAQALDLPLDALIVRKLGMPGMEEFAMGAVGSGGVRVLQEQVISQYAVPPAI